MIAHDKIISTSLQDRLLRNMYWKIQVCSTNMCPTIFHTSNIECY